MRYKAKLETYIFLDFIGGVVACVPMVLNLKITHPEKKAIK